MTVVKCQTRTSNLKLTILVCYVSTETGVGAITTQMQRELLVMMWKRISRNKRITSSKIDVKYVLSSPRIHKLITYCDEQQIETTVYWFPIYTCTHKESEMDFPKRKAELVGGRRDRSAEALGGCWIGSVVNGGGNAPAIISPPADRSGITDSSVLVSHRNSFIGRFCSFCPHNQCRCYCITAVITGKLKLSFAGPAKGSCSKSLFKIAKYSAVGFVDDRRYF